MTDKTFSKVTEIFSLCLTISNAMKTDVFFEYSPHVQKISIRIFYEGWQYARDNNDSNCDLEFSTYVDYSLDDEKTTNISLDLISNNLKDILKYGEIE